jgi:ABC-2 type transport system ATP-binding protein
MSLLEVRGLSRSFEAVRALEDVSFDLDAGVIMGFVGPNGAGKTTTMRILATLDTPSTGTVTLAGKSVLEQPDAVRPLIGYVPDRQGEYDDTSVREYLDFFARAYGLHSEQRRQRVDAVMAFTALAPLGDKLFSSLSKGVQQRASLARTLLHDPRLLILDEPADGLDPRARIELREMLRALAAQGKAILVSSHILSELSEICDACAIIEQGKLLAVGPVDEVANRAVGHVGAELAIRFVASDGHAAPIEHAQRLLSAQAAVAEVHADGVAGVRVRMVRPPPGTGDAAADADAARLLQILVGAGLPVCSLHYRRADLEDAFMSVTKGRVQ